MAPNALVVPAGQHFGQEYRRRLLSLADRIVIEVNCHLSAAQQVYLLLLRHAT
jgi:hypothetical protein